MSEIKYKRKGGAGVAFDSLVGMAFAKVEQFADSYWSGNDGIRFHANDGRVFELTHDQDCCENVYVESVTGDLADLVDAKVLRAEEAVSSDDKMYDTDDSHTWTFYKLATRKGYVDIRFYGSSNGYYSESVGLYEVAVAV